MEKIWANRVIAGSKTWEDVRRAGREEAVMDELMRRVEAGTLSEERYYEVIDE